MKKKIRKRFLAIFLLLTVIMSPCYTFASSYFGDKDAHSVLKDENEEEFFKGLMIEFDNDLTTQANLEISSPSAILLEAKTGTVIYEKNADEARRPASVTKVMTLLLI